MSAAGGCNVEAGGFLLELDEAAVLCAEVAEHFGEDGFECCVGEPAGCVVGHERGVGDVEGCGELMDRGVDGVAVDAPQFFDGL